MNQQLQSQVLIHVESIGNTRETRAILNQSCVDLIKQNFDGSLPISILAFGGNIGLGKSTCLSTIAMLLDPQINQTGQEVFRSSDSLQSFTKGIHCLPRPVFHSSNRNVQILLLDIEGMGGINEGISEQTQKVIQSQIDLLAMILSSNYVMMSSLRPNSSIISQLGIYFSNLLEVKDDLQISPPQFTVFIKDRQRDLEPQDKQQFSRVIQQSLGLPDSLLESMTFECLQKLPDGFDDRNKDYRAMKNTGYAQSLDNLVIRKGLFVKRDLVISQDMKLEKFCQLIKQSVDCINSNDFKYFFVQNLEKYVLELTTPYYVEFEQKFQRDLEKVLNEVDILKTQQDQFNNISQQCLQRALDEMIRAIKERIPRISDSQNPKHRKLLQDIFDSYKNNLKILLQKQQKNFEVLKLEKQMMENQQKSMIVQGEMNQQLIQLQEKLNQEMQRSKEEQDKLNKSYIDLQDKMKTEKEQADKEMKVLNDDHKNQVDDLKKIQKEQKEEFEKRVNDIQNKNEKNNNSDGNQKNIAQQILDQVVSVLVGKLTF